MSEYPEYVEKAAEALAFKLVVTRRGCEIHDDPLDCELPIQAAHILSKQALKRHGHEDALWDPRNGLGACYKAHRRSDQAVERFPAERLSDAFWAFADEVGLRWLAEKQYGDVTRLDDDLPVLPGGSPKRAASGGAVTPSGDTGAQAGSSRVTEAAENPGPSGNRPPLSVAGTQHPPHMGVPTDGPGVRGGFYSAAYLDSGIEGLA